MHSILLTIVTIVWGIITVAVLVSILVIFIKDYFADKKEKEELNNQILK